MSGASSIPGACVHTCDADGCGATCTTAAFGEPLPEGWWSDPHGWISTCPRHALPSAVHRELARLHVDRCILEAFMGEQDIAPMVAKAAAAEVAETQRRTVELEAALIEARGERDDLRAVLETRDARWRIFDEVNAERVRQDAKWGEQNHPDVDRVLTDRRGGCDPQRMAEEYGIPHPSRARAECDHAARIGQCTWAHIAVEEMAEAVEAATLAQLRAAPRGALRKELVQLAAVIVAWIEAIDRRGDL